MKKTFSTYVFHFTRKHIRNLLFVSNLIVYVFLFGLQAHSNVISHMRMDTNFKNIYVEELINELEDRIPTDFHIDSEELRMPTPPLSYEGNETEWNARNAESIGRDFENELSLLAQSNAELSSNQSQQQNQSIRLIKGTVSNSSGEPLPGASIQVKGTTNGTITDSEGHFTLQITSEAKVVVISFIGMKSLEVEIGKTSNFNIKLEPESLNISEVLITGYQTVLKEKSASSFVNVDKTALSMRPVSSISQALSGLTSGMTSSQDAFGRSRFTIRGVGTLLNNVQYSSIIDNDPLIVVDGFPILGYSDVADNSIKDPFASINPNDIESVVVLKDASATSIYGARAANGVIVITTRKGTKREKLKVAFNAFTSYSDKIDLDYAFNIANTSSMFKMLDALKNNAPSYWNSLSQNPYAGSTSWRKTVPKASELFIELERGNITQAEFDSEKSKLIELDGKWMSDYQKYIFQKQTSQQYNLSMSGGSEKSMYTLSAVYDHNRGYSIGDNDEKLILNLSNIYDLTPAIRFSINMNTHIVNSKKNGVNLQILRQYTAPYTRLVDDAENFLNMPYSNTVYSPIYDRTINGKMPEDWSYNPVVDRSQTDFSTKSFNYRLQAGLDFKLLEGLKFSQKFQYERNSYNTRNTYLSRSFIVRDLRNTYSTLNPNTGLYSTPIIDGGILDTFGDISTSYNLRSQLDFNRTFANIHEVTGMLGGEIISQKSENIPSVRRYGYNPNTNAVVTTLDYISSISTVFGTTGRPYSSGLGGIINRVDNYLSAYFNASYTYDRKYTVTGSLRTDATNYVSDALRKKFSPFYSVGAVWNIKNEGFFSSISIIDELRLRGSYGLAGIAAGKRNTATLTTLRTLGGSLITTNGEPSMLITSIGNPTLTWEKTKTLNLGVDFNLFKGKFSGSADFYDRKSYDLLFPVEVPYISQSSGTSIYNNADVVNRGFELSLKSTQKITNKLSWTGSLSLSHNTNKVLKILSAPGIRPTRYTYSGNTLVEGRPIDRIYVTTFKGITPEGWVIQVDKEGNEYVLKDANIASRQNYNFNRSAGENIENYPWIEFLGSKTPLYDVGFVSTFKFYNFSLMSVLTGKFSYYFFRNDNWNASKLVFNASKTIDESISLQENGYNADKFTVLPWYNAKNSQVMDSWFGHLQNMYSNERSAWERGDHIRLNELFLGYDVPANVLAKVKYLNSLNVYCQVRNLGILWAANNKGYDPDYIKGSIRPFRTWTFGLKLNF